MRALLVAIVLTTALCSTAIAGPKEEALQVVEQWVQTLTDADVEGNVKLYAPDALILSSASKTVMTKPEEIHQYFEQALLRNRPRTAKLGDHSVMVLSDTVVVVTGLDTITGVQNGKPYSNYGRVTFVVEKRGADWQIAHMHRSVMPN
jgi:uncharacterized protein (TIGR02246 family)